MRSFHNDSQSIIRSTDETHINIKPKKENKQVLPDIKVNIIIDEGSKPPKNQLNHDSDDSDFENKKNNMMTYMKLPAINKIEANKMKNAGSNYFNSGEYKTNQMKHNLSNQSLEIQINTVYPNKNKNTKKVRPRLTFFRNSTT